MQKNLNTSKNVNETSNEYVKKILIVFLFGYLYWYNLIFQNIYVNLLLLSLEYKILLSFIWLALKNLLLSNVKFLSTYFFKSEKLPTAKILPLCNFLIPLFLTNLLKVKCLLFF